MEGRVPDSEPRQAPSFGKLKPRQTLDLEEPPKLDSPRDWRSTIWFPDDPGFVYYMRQGWRDLLSLAILFVIPLFLHLFAHPLTPKYFPLERAGLAPQYMYPLLPEYITTTVSAILSFGVPFAVMGLCSIFLIGDFWDCNSAVRRRHLSAPFSASRLSAPKLTWKQCTGLGFALCTASMFQILLKLFIGGMRPHFYAVCQPSSVTTLDAGPDNLLYTRSACANPSAAAVTDALLSFPSGHCTAAFAGFLYLALWVNAKFKVCADYKSRHWQQVLLVAPLSVAALLALSKIADYWHHWHDVVAGSLIGAAFAMLSYRQMYCAVWDWRRNHVPLPYAFEVREGKGRSTDTRELTCIDFAGWRNKYSRRREEREKREKMQVDGPPDDGAKGGRRGMWGRWDLMHFLV